MHARAHTSTRPARAQTVMNDLNTFGLMSKRRGINWAHECRDCVNSHGCVRATHNLWNQQKHRNPRRRDPDSVYSTCIALECRCRECLLCNPLLGRHQLCESVAKIPVLKIELNVGADVQCLEIGIYQFFLFVSSSCAIFLLLKQTNRHTKRQKLIAKVKLKMFN